MIGTVTGQLELRIRLLLPEQYQDSYQDIQPVPMRSAGLQYDPDGNVAWDRIWGSFCDLAMAGGPPHKGALLEPGTQAEIDAQFGRYDEVVDEICRGIEMVTGLRAYPSPTPGWVSVTCLGDAMAGWTRGSRHPREPAPGGLEEARARVLAPVGKPPGSMDEVRYNERGNQVTLIKRFNKQVA